MQNGDNESRPMSAHQFGIVPALDVDSIDTACRLVDQLSDIEGIEGYKIGAQLALERGLLEAVTRLQTATSIPLMYDHQKVGLDVPSNAAGFAACVAAAGVTSVIVFPVAGPTAVQAFVGALVDHGLKPIVGAALPIDDYFVSAGGWLDDDVLLRVLDIAVGCGATSVVVPGGRAGTLGSIVTHFGDGPDLEFLVPGVPTSPGELGPALAEAGPHRAFAVIGRAICRATDPRSAAQRLCDEALSTVPHSV